MKKNDLFNILVTGAGRSGKSTLVNALVGKQVCPAWRGLTTTVCTEIIYGEQYRMTVYPLSESEDKIVIENPSDEDTEKYCTSYYNKFRR